MSGQVRIKPSLSFNPGSYCYNAAHFIIFTHSYVSTLIPRSIVFLQAVKLLSSSTHLDFTYGRKRSSFDKITCIGFVPDEMQKKK